MLLIGVSGIFLVSSQKRPCNLVYLKLFRIPSKPDKRGFRVLPMNWVHQILPMKSTLAKTGPLADMEACTRWGYLERTQAARLPGYEPPKAIHLVPAGKLCSVFIAVIKYAMSAKACSLERYFRFSTLRSLNNIIKI